MEINLCVPILNRYDRFQVQFDSIMRGTVIPNIYVVDNGNKIYTELPKYILDQIHVYSPGYNIGVASSWNYFIQNISEIRVISNDDISFGKDAMKIFLEHYDEDYMMFPPINKLNQFSCFVLSDKIIKQVGLFDEDISPNYGYFEDNDYSYRMQLLGIKRKQIENMVIHHSSSSTVKMFDAKERKEHDAKFKLAKSNYIKKWDGEPGQEKYTTPFNH